MSLWIDFEKHQNIVQHYQYTSLIVQPSNDQRVFFICCNLYNSHTIMLWLVTSPVWRLMLAIISLFWTYTIVQFITQSTPFTVDTVGTSRDLATVHFIWVSVVIVYHYICYSVSNSYWARSMYAVTVKPMCSLINTVL